MDREVMAAKQVYDETGDAARAYGKLEKKRNRCIEGKLLGGLMKHAENDYVNALENVSYLLYNKFNLFLTDIVVLY